MKQSRYILGYATPQPFRAVHRANTLASAIYLQLIRYWRIVVPATVILLLLGWWTDHLLTERYWRATVHPRMEVFSFDNDCLSVIMNIGLSDSREFAIGTRVRCDATQLRLDEVECDPAGFGSSKSKDFIAMRTAA